MTPSTEASFGEFGTTELGQFINVQNSLREEISRVAGIPLHYFHLSKGDFPSGEAMKSAEARFTKKLRDRQISFGNVWEDAMRLALRMEGYEVEGEFLDALWDDPSPRSEREDAETAARLREVGVPLRWRLERAGFPQTVIEDILASAGKEGGLPPSPMVAASDAANGTTP